MTVAIPTHEEFVLKVGKGPNLNKVTEALRIYWTDKGNRTLDEELAALKSLMDECKAWIKLKDSKSEFKKGLFGTHTSYFNTKFLDRRQAIATLAENATKELMVLLQRNDLLKSDVRGQLSFDIRKFREKGKRLSSRHTTKELSHGYEQERQTWLGSGKTKAISGSKIHDLIKGQGGVNESTLTKVQKKSYQSILQGGGSSEQWRILSQVDQLGDLQVAYLRKSQRYEYMAFIKNGLFEDGENKPIDTADMNMSGQVLWTMDRYGNMFIYDDYPLGKKVGIRQVNHSTMNAGKEVICAGMIRVDKGQVTKITNTSGHYKPTHQHFAEALTILSEEGLDLSGAEVMAVRFPGPAKGKAWWQTFDPVDLIRSGGNCRPLKEEEGPEP
jgi:hypothetical protein